VESGEILHSLKTHEFLKAAAFHPAKHLLAYAGEERRNDIGSLHLFEISK
jgi:hypothetical protein